MHEGLIRHCWFDPTSQSSAELTIQKKERLPLLCLQSRRRPTYFKMTGTSINLLLGALFVLLGALNVSLILHASRVLTTSRMSQRLIQAHRLGGYSFIALFCLMSYFMALRTTDPPDELSMRALVHVLIAMSLVPLLFVKVLIARYYKSYYSALTSLGVIIFCLAFLLVALTAGPYLLRATSAKGHFACVD